MLAGILVGHDLFSVIYQSTIVMLGCWFVGRFVGYLMQETVSDYLARYRQENPIPQIHTPDQQNIVEVVSDSAEESALQPDLPLGDVAQMGKAA